MWQVDCNHQEIGDEERDTIIEEDVWIGYHVTLLPGVTIGRGSIIGAGSLVTKSIPPYTIAVGAPCKVIKLKYSKEEIKEREKKLYPLPTTIKGGVYKQFSENILMRSCSFARYSSFYKLQMS